MQTYSYAQIARVSQSLKYLVSLKRREREREREREGERERERERGGERERESVCVCVQHVSYGFRQGWVVLPCLAAD